jgi:glycosyltransferase involved in cell wall biosynthesis
VHVTPTIESWKLRRAWRGPLPALRKALDEDRIDIVHLIYPDPYLRYHSDSYHLPFLLKLASSRPLVVTFFGFGVTGASLVTKAGLLSLFAAADRLVITDADLLRRFRRNLPWWSQKAQGGVVGSIAAPSSATWSEDALVGRKVALGLRPDQRHVGFFGFWSPDKGIENLLEAVQRLRRAGQDVVLALIGGRAPSDRIESEQALLRLAGELGIAESVIDTGPLEPEDVARYMVAMDMCALPFKVNPLGRSSLALALSLGVPTVVTRPPDDGARLLSGLALLESPEPTQIAAAIERLLPDRIALRAASQAALAAAGHWSWETIVDEYEALYAELEPVTRRPR